jgi:hypothetical protein
LGRNKASVWVAGKIDNNTIHKVLKAPVWVSGGRHPINIPYTCWPVPTGIV